MNWLDLENKVVIVTGCASGIGYKLCIDYLEQGCKVIGIDLKENDKISELIKNDHFIFYQVDITNEDQVSEFADKIEQMYNVDILVNNAGVNIPCLLVDDNQQFEVDSRKLNKMIEVNINGVVYLTQKIAKQMKKQNNGVVVNMCSECSLEGSQGQGIYAATKGAIYSLTRSWAKELGKYNVRIVGVAPGILEETGLRTIEYETALAYTRDKTVEELRAGYDNVSAIPIGRIGKIKEISDLVLYLSSDRASYIHGTTIDISGGKTRG